MNLTYPAAVEALFRLRRRQAQLDLTAPVALAARFDNPQRDLRFIHVAGTNGKGSTCAMLESIYRHAGCRVGLFTSPHLVSLRERIQVDRQLIPEAAMADLVTELQRRLALEPALRVSFFEAMTVLALEYFRQCACDLVIWETGLGGRLDATNIVTPLAGVITNVQLDHEHILGGSIPEIAREKAGIIKCGVPIITGARDREALRVIRVRAAAERAPLIVVDPHNPAHRLPDGVTLPLPGKHQMDNASVVLAAVGELADCITVSPRAIAEGFRRVQWAGRLQSIFRGPQEIILDGVHNPAAAEAVAAALRSRFAPRELVLIFGSLQDKNWPAMCRLLAPLASQIHVVRVKSSRAAEVDEIAAAMSAAHPGAAVATHAELSQALAASATAATVICGSLYLVGEALRLLQNNGAAAEEMELNDWFVAGPHPAPRPV